MSDGFTEAIKKQRTYMNKNYKGVIEIDKTFDFCYGHRVWSQELMVEYAEDTCLKCRHLHGHQGQIKVYLQNAWRDDTLNNGMVTDFKHLGWFKKWLDINLDHKFIMDINDPVIPSLFSDLNLKELIDNPSDEFKQTKVIPPKYFSGENSPMDEIYEGLVFVDFVPTSENLSKWLAQIINLKMSKINIFCTKIEFNETPKSRSTWVLK